MRKISLNNFGPIQEVKVEIADLTILIGEQASGKSIFLQLLKFLFDKNYIRKVLEQYNYEWKNDLDYLFRLYFGEGMQNLWHNATKVFIEGSKEIGKDFFFPKKGEKYSEVPEKLFYVPAQRILAVADGRPKTFMEFDETVPFVLRYFSESIRLMLQKEIIKTPDLFPSKQRLKNILREQFDSSIFHNHSVTLEEKSGQKKFRMKSANTSIPFMTWSAGQKEFMPLLLAFYWLCPPSKKSKKDNIELVVIEEPEMGLHPQAIKAVILQIVDLLTRGYKVIISTHSAMILEFAWAFQMIKNTPKDNKSKNNAIIRLFDFTKNTHTQQLFKNIESKELKTFFFEHTPNGVVSKDISSLDAYSDDIAIAEWGNLTSFSSKASEIVAEFL
ncbi:AAA family ATPase [Raineya sp.]|jgi:predicted ATPase